MKFKTILLAIAILMGGAFTASAQSNKAHLKAHRNLQARNVSPIERQQANALMQKEIAKREHGGLSRESEILIDDLLTEARRHIGAPYVWGARGPKTFDCSGFTSYVYRQMGIKIQPTSVTQFNTDGKPVAKNEMRKGDLIFFTSPRNGYKGVGHVGIVYSVDPATGAVKFIHAGPRGIAIQDFNENYERRYMGARRVINE